MQQDFYAFWCLEKCEVIPADSCLFWNPQSFIIVHIATPSLIVNLYHYDFLKVIFRYSGYQICKILSIIFTHIVRIIADFLIHFIKALVLKNIEAIEYAILATCGASLFIDFAQIFISPTICLIGF